MKAATRFIQVLLFGLLAAASATAHPLGNFAISHYTRIATDNDRLRLRYIVDYAEITAFQELQTLDADRNGQYSKAEKDAWLARNVAQWLTGLRLTANGQPLALHARSQTLALLPGAVKLLTMRIECELEAPFVLGEGQATFTLTDTNHADRQGWHEIVLQPVAGVTVFDSTAFGDGLTDELKTYPENDRQAPPDERSVTWSATNGALRANAKPLLTRAGQPVAQNGSRYTAWLKPLAYAVVLGILLLALTHRIRHETLTVRTGSLS
jgi:nickel/cobalt transporter (NicO) family protein